MLNDSQQLALGHFIATVHNLKGTPKSKEKDTQIMNVIMQTRNALLALGMSHAQALKILKQSVAYACSEKGNQELSTIKG